MSFSTSSTSVCLVLSVYYIAARDHADYLHVHLSGNVHLYILDNGLKENLKCEAQSILSAGVTLTLKCTQAGEQEMVSSNTILVSIDSH